MGHGQPGPGGKYNLGDSEDGGMSPEARVARASTPGARSSVSPRHRGAGAAHLGAGAGGFSRVEAKMHIGSGEERFRAEPQQVSPSTLLGNRAPHCCPPLF